MDIINLNKRGAQIPYLYHYEVIARMNDHQFTLVRVRDRMLDFHTHPDSDEVFLIVAGQMQLEFQNRIVTLKTGDMCVVPKRTLHRPVCTEEVTCLLIERQGTLTPENTGGTYKNQEEDDGSKCG